MTTRRPCSPYPQKSTPRPATGDIGATLTEPATRENEARSCPQTSSCSFLDRYDIAFDKNLAAVRCPLRITMASNTRASSRRRRTSIESSSRSRRSAVRLSFLTTSSSSPPFRHSVQSTPARGRSCAPSRVRAFRPQPSTALPQPPNSAERGRSEVLRRANMCCGSSPRTCRCIHAMTAIPLMDLEMVIPLQDADLDRT